MLNVADLVINIMIANVVLFFIIIAAVIVFNFTILKMTVQPLRHGQCQPRYVSGRIAALPDSLLGAAVDVCPVVDEMSGHLHTAANTALVQGRVTRVVPGVHVDRLGPEAIQSYLLLGGRIDKNYGLTIVVMQI